MFKQHLGLIISLTILLAGLTTGVILVRQQQITEKQAAVNCPAPDNAYCTWDAVPADTPYFNGDYYIELVEEPASGAIRYIFRGNTSDTYYCFRVTSGSNYSCRVTPRSRDPNACNFDPSSGSKVCQPPPTPPTPTPTATPTLTPAPKPNLTIGIQDLAPAQPVGGDDVSFRIKVWETNNVAVQNRFWYKLELTKIIGMYPQIIERYERYLDNLGASGVRIPFDSGVLSNLADMEQGHYIISAYVDSSFTAGNTNLIDETSEADNEAHLDFYVGAAPTLTPTPTPTPSPTPTPTVPMATATPTPGDGDNCNCGPGTDFTPGYGGCGERGCASTQKPYYYCVNNCWQAARCEDRPECGTAPQPSNTPVPEGGGCFSSNPSCVSSCSSPFSCYYCGGSRPYCCLPPGGQCPSGVNPYRTADINQDGSTNYRDASIMMSAWGKSKADDGFNSAADINNDGKVNALDISLFIIQL